MKSLGLIIKDEAAVCVWSCFCIFCPVPLVLWLYFWHFHAVLSMVSLQYKLQIRDCYAPCFAFLALNCFSWSRSLLDPYEFRIILPNSMRNAIIIFIVIALRLFKSLRKMMASVHWLFISKVRKYLSFF